MSTDALQQKKIIAMKALTAYYTDLAMVELELMQASGNAPNMTFLGMRLQAMAKRSEMELGAANSAVKYLDSLLNPVQHETA